MLLSGLILMKFVKAGRNKALSAIRMGEGLRWEPLYIPISLAVMMARAISDAGFCRVWLWA